MFTLLRARPGLPGTQVQLPDKSRSGSCSENACTGAEPQAPDWERPAGVRVLPAAVWPNLQW